MDKGFNPGSPPIHFGLKQLNKTKFRYYVTAHHALLDGWSVAIFLDQLRHYISTPQIGLMPKATFKTYIQYIQELDHSAALEFWNEYLGGVKQPTELQLPKAQVTPDIPNSATNCVLHPQANRIQNLARLMNTTPYTFIKAAWALLLSRYTDQTDVIFGNTVSGRALPLEGIEEIVGCLINTLPFRV
ncbi:condensation domain-containing protein, partial [Dimargaris cristalligena]